MLKKPKITTTFLPKIEVNFINGKVHIDGEQVNYSFGNLHYVFRQAIKLHKTEILQTKQVLILGFGAGSIAKILVNELLYNGKMIGIDAEARMIDLAKQYAGIDNWNNIELHETSALNYITKCSAEFDCILIDLFIEDVIPQECISEPFINGLKSLLKPNALILLNCLRNSTQLKELEILLSKFPALTTKVHIINSDNLIIEIRSKAK